MGSVGELLSREVVRASGGVVSREMGGEREAFSREGGEVLSSVRHKVVSREEKMRSLKGEKMETLDSVSEGAEGWKGEKMVLWWGETGW